MTKEELDKFEKELSIRGYKKYPSYNDSKYAWFKSFGESEYEEDRSNYQIAFSVWDFSEYAHIDNYLRKTPYSVSPEVLTSRTIDERVDLVLSSIMSTDSDKDKSFTTNIMVIEKIADSFFKWAEQNIEIK